MQRIFVAVDLPDKNDANYLQASARIRDISCQRLLSRLVDVVLKDQLIFAILDDESKQPKKLPHEESESRYRKLSETSS